MPDDAALLLPHVVLGGLDAKILMHARQLFDAGVEYHEVVHQLDQPALGAQLEQILVQLETAVVLLVFFPLEEVFLRRADGAVLQAFRVVAGKDELHCAEEPGVEIRQLVRQVLPDAVADAHPAVFQLQHADGDAVHVQNNVGPPFKISFERYLLHDHKVVFLRLVPVEQMHCLRDLARLSFHRHTVTQQVVDEAWLLP